MHLFLLIPLFFISVNTLPVRRDSSDPYPLALRALHNPHLFSGDIIRYPKFQHNRNAVVEQYWRWPNKEIPYLIDDALAPHKTQIKNAMYHISQYTCIRFKELTKRPDTTMDFVHIIKGDGCYSTIGKDDDNQEMISLGEGCYYDGTIIHELMHTIGFYHLQNRSDRDDFLKIYWNNIEEKYKGEFEKMNPRDNLILVDFDYNSIMLYGPHSYSKDGRSITMEPTFKQYKMIEVFEKPGLTQLDAEAIKKLYKC